MDEVNSSYLQWGLKGISGEDAPESEMQRPNVSPVWWVQGVTAITISVRKLVSSGHQNEIISTMYLNNVQGVMCMIAHTQ